MTKSADTDLLGIESQLQTSQSALETEENPRLSQGRTDSGTPAAATTADAARSAEDDAEETTAGRGENAAGFLKGTP